MTERSAGMPAKSRLSEGEQGLWMLQRLFPEMAAYNVPVAFRIEGSLDPQAFKSACEFLFKQYPILSALIREEEGVLYHIISESEELPFGQQDVANLRETEIVSIFRKLASEPFVFESEPPIRVHLLTGATHHYVLIVLHHIVCDGISTMRILRTLWQAYSEYLAGRIPDLQKEEATYSDYVTWETAMLASPQAAEHSEYWKQCLQGPIPILALPLDRSRPSSPSFRGATYTVALPPETAVAARSLSVAQRTNLASLFLTAFKMLLFRYTGQEDIIVGMPAITRPQRRFQETVGYFINMVSIRSRISASDRASQILPSLQKTLLGALDHAVYPFSRVIGDLKLGGDHALAPVFQVAFLYQNFLEGRSIHDLKLPESTGAASELLQEIHQEGEYDLGLEVFEEKAGFVFNLKFNPDLFDSSTISRISGHYLALLREIVKDPSLKVADCELMSESEQHQLLVGWNETARSFNWSRLIHELFADQAIRNPGKVAVRFEDSWLTYEQLDERSNRLALHLQRLGVRPDSLVGICVHRSLDMVVGLIGILKSGAAYVPIDPDYPAERVRYMVQDSQIKLMVTESRLEQQAAEFAGSGDVRLVVIDREWHEIEAATGALLCAVQPEHLAYVIYTSGSTGRPKGVMVEHRSVVNFLLSMREATGFGDDERLFAVTTYCFDIAGLEIYLPLTCGGEVCLCRKEKLQDAGLLQQEIGKLRPTVMQATPATWTMLFQSGWTNQERIKIFCGGEALGEKLRDEFIASNSEAWNLFGPTETTIWSTCKKITTRDKITIGKPIANTQVYVLDAQLHPVPIGVVGELYIAGSGLARGYWNLPELTREKFIPNPFDPPTKMYRTGDLALWLSNGEIEFLGRIDHQIKIRGFRIECEEIEAVLQEHPSIASAVVVPKDINGMQLVAYYVAATAETSLEAADLKSHLRNKLPEYMVPAIYVTIKALPLTPNGKVDRTALMRKEVTVARIQRFVPPQTQIEKKLTHLFEQVLKVKSVGITDNFFETGAHSLLLVEIAYKLRKEFGHEVRVTDLFAHPTIESLAHFLRSNFGLSEAAEIQPSIRTAEIGSRIGLSVDNNKDAHDSGYAPMDIAIIGAACHFPQSRTVQEFWRNLCDARECIHFFSDEELQAAGVPQSEYGHPEYVKAKALIEDIGSFDASFFKYSPKEAEVIDPQQRLFLEVCHQALEDAGYVPNEYSKRIGIFAGSGINVYLPYHIIGNADYPIDPYQWMIGNAADHLCTRVAYKLNLKGPAVTTQTACSTSLVAVHQAIESLIRGEAEIAIAGGVSIEGGFERTGYRKLVVLSPDGHCRPFDAKASGTVIGQGAGAVVLKPVRQAIQDHDYIYAVIKGSAINNDGSLKAGYTAPSVEGQQQVIRMAQERAGIDADTITYVEAHGTATPLGDPIEIEALTRAFRKKTPKKQFCAIGSVKSNVGHLDAAAGVAGLIKTILCLKNRKLAPSLHYETPNPEINFESSPFYVNSHLQDWNTTPGASRRAGVSSFGIGGSNAHVVLEEFVPHVTVASSPANPIDPLVLAPLSAKSPKQLKLYAEKLLVFVNQLSNGADAQATPENANATAMDLINLSYTLQVGREAMEYRVAFVVHDFAELQQKLEAYVAGIEVENCFQGSTTENRSNLDLLEEDEDSRDLVQKWISKGKLAKLARLWANGLNLEWTQLYAGWKPYRIPLPTYPFARERYWIPEARLNSALAAQGRAVSGQTIIHPLVQENTSNLDEQQFTSIFTGKEFFLDDHRVQGERMLPGMAYLEMARAATAISSKDSVIGFRDVVWRKPITVNGAAQKTVIRLYPEQEAIAYEVASSAVDVTNEPEVCSQGLVLVGAGQKKPESIDIGTILRRCASQRSAEEIYASFHQHGIDYGRSFRAIQQVVTNGEEALGTFRVPLKIIGSEQFLLHPAIMDAALHVLPGLVAADDSDRGAYVPFSIGAVEIHGPTPATGYAYVRCSSGSNRNGAVLKYDIDITDEQGHVCVVMREFAARLISGQSRAHDIATSLIYGAQEWQKLSLEQAPAQRDIPTNSPSPIVFIAPPAGGPNAFVQRLDGCQFIQLPTSAGLTPGEFIEKCFHFVLERIQQLIRSKSAEQQLLMVCVPHNASRYLYAPLAGLLKTASMENPRITAKLLYIEEIDHLSAEVLARVIQSEIVQSEISMPDGPVEIRYNANGEREAKVLVEITPERNGNARAVSIRANGVYWITGGAGGLGKIIAASMTQSGNVTVVLSGRSALSADDQKQLQGLANGSGKLVYLPGDVSKLEDVVRILDQIRKDYGPLNGIIHAAGVIQDSFLIKKTQREVQAVFAPKIKGLLNIDEATCHDQLDFILLFSSLAAVFGGVGQADYASANAFLDAYAEHRNALVEQGIQSGKTLSINWPLWREGGMSVPLEIEKLTREKLGIEALLTAPGLAAFEIALQASHSNIIVLSGDASRIRRTVFGSNSLQAISKNEKKLPIDTSFPVTSKVADANVAGNDSLKPRTVQYLKRELSVMLKFSANRLNENDPLEDYGIDSMMAIDLTNALEKSFGGLSKTLFFEYHTIGELADYFVNNHRATLMSLLGEGEREQPAQRESAITANPGSVAARAPKTRFRSRSAAPQPAGSSGALDVAIIGLSGRYPLAESVAQLWKLLRAGEDCVTEIPKDRWNHDSFYDPDKGKWGTIYSKWGGFMSDVDKFDPLFFKISPREAEVMDPQERLFLECAWSTLEDAGYTREKIKKMTSASGGLGGKVGVYAGSMYAEYQLFGAEETARGNVVALSGTPANIANRVSYYCNFHGPSITLDTMCSSSLTAIYLACQSLRSGECDMALAGGVNVTVHPNKYLLLSQGQFISSKGHCESFGRGGDGYIPGEGVGCVLLKPLESAIVDRDHIYGVIKSVSINHGGKTNGYTVPNPKAQSAVILETLQRAGVDPQAISYVEAHGTGTELGDPIEITGLTQAFSKDTRRKQYCAIGSVKSNIGHLEAAAGIAGVTKVLLQMQHRQLAPSLHARELNPNIKFEETPFVVQQELGEWRRPVVEQNGASKEYLRIAGISSFGAGGSNAHVIVQEYAGEGDEGGRGRGEDRVEREVVIPLSARSAERLQVYAEKLLRYLDEEALERKELAEKNGGRSG
ncbi:MAG TPA: amino acid adenylation domain-containing protein, partial [Candidatus Angelobacter sp.]|nr:amino acid adenylation domain-containing protein [Candidatus Angelobacter sp.]